MDKKFLSASELIDAQQVEPFDDEEDDCGYVLNLERLPEILLKIVKTELKIHRGELDPLDNDNEEVADSGILMALLLGYLEAGALRVLQVAP